LRIKPAHLIMDFDQFASVSERSKKNCEKYLMESTTSAGARA